MILKTFGLFVLTAISEILGCYLPMLWLNHGKSIWLLLPAALSLVIFSWLLTLHPEASGRVYAAYGGVYISVAILWLYFVDKVTPSLWDIIGTFIIILGVLIIVLGNAFKTL